MSIKADLIILGGGAAGLTAAIFAKQAAPDKKIIIVDSARKLGAKIKVAGGGRCNVTHETVRPEDFNGSSPNSIKKVLKQFTVKQTIDWFESLGLALAVADSGKLFPTSNKAQDVVTALLDQTRRLGIVVYTQTRIESLRIDEHTIGLEGNHQHFTGQAVILATGGKSLPKTGSDGMGYRFTKQLGHRITQRVMPALVPLTMQTQASSETSGNLTDLAGLSHPVNLWLQNQHGKILQASAGSLLCTHFGLSGPVVLDMSRHWTEHRQDHDLTINWLGTCHHFKASDLQIRLSPAQQKQQVQTELAQALQAGQARQVDTVIKALSQQRNFTQEPLPQRLLTLLAKQANLDTHQTCQSLTRQQRQQWVQLMTDYAVVVTGDRGYTYAEVTAGGVPLSEIKLAQMQSRLNERVFLCGELCDVDGRIGGFNFQWAWASGYVAGRGAADYLSK